MDTLNNSKMTAPFKGTKLEEATKHSQRRSRQRGSGDIRSAISNTDGCEHYVCPECGEEYPSYIRHVECCGMVLTLGGPNEDS